MNEFSYKNRGIESGTKGLVNGEEWHHCYNGYLWRENK